MQKTRDLFIANISCLVRAIVVALGLNSSLFAQSEVVEVTVADSYESDSPSSNLLATERMVLQLRENDWLLQTEALLYLAKHKVIAATQPIRELLERQSNPAWLRGRALLSLVQIDANAQRKTVFEFANSDDSTLRGSAAESLEFLDGDDVDPVLEKLLNDQTVSVRYRALNSYAKRYGVKAWPIAEPMLASIDARHCQWVASALARIGNDTAFERLTQLTDRDELLAPTVRGIQSVDNPRLIGVLLRILAKLPPDDPRFAACLTALHQFGQTKLVAALKSSLDSDSNELIRMVALVTTLMTPAPELGDPLRQAASRVKDVETIKAVLVALGPIPMKPDRHRELFVEQLKHDDPEIRALSIRCLAHCESVNLYEQLRKSLTDESSDVVEAALGVLLRAKTSDAPRGQLVAYLKSPLLSDEVRIQRLAYELLSHAGSAEDFNPAMELLGDRLRSTDDDIRNATAIALGEFAPHDRINQLVTRQGYLSRWMVLGTFLNDQENSGFKRVYPPEEKIDFEAKYTAKYVWALDGQIREQGELQREISWSEASVNQSDGKMIVPVVVPPPAALAIAYLVSDVSVNDQQEALLSVDGDDAFRVMLNGKMISELVAPYIHRSACVAEQKGIKVTLRKGVNRIMVKTANIDHDWWVRIRLTNSEGQPVELNHEDKR